MILKTAYWDTNAMSTPAREFNFINPVVVHRFNECARVVMKIADPTGEMLQKYDSDADGHEIYVSSGQALLYDLDGNCVFNGRILSSERAGTILSLVCEDWMNQLKDERIHYDFREDLNGSGLRESGAHGHIDSGTQEYRAPAYTLAAWTYLIDGDMDWDIDEWNAYKLVFPQSNFGKKTIKLGPYAHGITNGSKTANGWANVWVDDSNFDRFEENDFLMTAYFEFWLQVTEGSLFDSISSAKITLNAEHVEGCNALGSLGILFGIWQWTLNDYVWIDKVCTATAGSKEKKTIEIPADLISDMVDSDGTVKIGLYGEGSGAQPDIKIYFAELKVEVETSGILASYTITDTLRDPADTGADYNTLKIADSEIELGVTGLGIWEEFNYSIIGPIYNRINAIVTAGDPLVALTTSVESTSGITSIHLSDLTRFEILQKVAPIDAAVFWVPLGTTQVNWKKTTDASKTTLQDWEVIRWMKTRYDKGPFRSHAIVYGTRIENEEVVSSKTHTDAMVHYDTKITEVLRNAGILSSYEAGVVAQSIIVRQGTIPLQLSVELAGFSDIRLGDWIEVTSKFLGITAGDYTVDRWEYSDNTTKIRLQPRGTDGYILFREFAEEIQEHRRSLTEIGIDRDRHPMKTQIWD